MSFGSHSNPPWQRNNLNNVLPSHVSVSASVGQIPSAGISFHQGAPPQMLLHQTQGMNFTHGSLPAAGTSGIFQQSGITSVPYQQGRTGLNPVAFQNSGANSQLSQTQNRSQQYYNSVGTITKVNNDCGLVNDDIFFFRNVCKGSIPKLGDRVVFESSFSPNGQFKWNATRIQVMQPSGMNTNQVALLGGNSNNKGSGYIPTSAPNDYQRAQSQQQRRISPRRTSPGKDRLAHNDRMRRDRHRKQRSRELEEDGHERKRRREDREHSKDRGRNVGRNDRERERDRNRDDIKREHDQSIDRTERERDRERRDENKDRERSPTYRSGIKARRTRTIRRYMVQIPKLLLTFKRADIQELRQRYATLYIPSDFFHAENKWTSVFTHDNPFSLQRPCQFHIMHKIVEPLTSLNGHAYDPEDADYLFSAKVMLMSCPPVAEFYQKCFEDDDGENEQNTVHPSRLISFLVGTRSRNEPMAIGGPWSPSLDGENPDKDPAVLIRTAIRTCKGLTGIDLSNCTQWYRFVELYYHRNDHKNKNKDTTPPRIETVVIYLPDVHSCIPTVNEWETLTQGYKAAVERMISRKPTTPPKSTSTSIEGGGSTVDSSTLASGDFNVETTSTTIVGTSTADGPVGGQEQQHASISANIANTAHRDQGAMEVSADGDDNDNEKMDERFTEEEDSNQRNSTAADHKIISAGDNATVVTSTNQYHGKEQITKVDNNIVNKPTAAEPCGDDSQGNENNEAPVTKAADNENKEDDNDEHEDWADVDMNDIVILDEYDSSKNNDDGPKELGEKDKMQLMRRYTLPSTPHIIVHPSKTAKGGKFDCSIMSLSVLLDYRPEDTKERFFEVSLFAELFNEMLMRDFGFNIYKELYMHKESNHIDLEDQEDSSLNKKDELKVNEDEEKTKDGGNGGNVENKMTTEQTNTKRIAKQSDPDSEDGNQFNKATGVERRRKTTTSVSEKKMIVMKPDLLLSFLYFDTSHCGYIFEKDLEDLFSILGLNLSRSQIRKVLGKTASRQAFYYRKLTDTEEVTEGGGLEIPETVEEMSKEDMKRISLGNKLYFPIFKSETDVIEDPNKTCNDLVNYNGAMIHIGKLVDQIKRAESNFSDLEKLYNDLRKQHADLQKEHSKSTCKIKDLQSDLKGMSRKLSETDQDLYTVNRKYKDQQATLSVIYHRVAPYFGRHKDYKKESSREKDNDRHKDKDGGDKGRESKAKSQCNDELKNKKGNNDQDIKNEDDKDVLEIEIDLEEQLCKEEDIKDSEE